MYLPCLSAEISIRIQKSAVVSIGVGFAEQISAYLHTQQRVLEHKGVCPIVGLEPL
jgi:hypothetical protein